MEETGKNTRRNGKRREEPGRNTKKREETGRNGKKQNWKKQGEIREETGRDGKNWKETRSNRKKQEETGRNGKKQEETGRGRGRRLQIQYMIIKSRKLFGGGGQEDKKTDRQLNCDRVPSSHKNIYQTQAKLYKNLRH